MSLVRNKFIVYSNDDGNTLRKSLTIPGEPIILKRSDYEVWEVYEESVPKGNLHIFKLMLSLIFNKKFRYLFNETFKYGLRHEGSYRGAGSSDVYLFKCQDNWRKYWDKPKKERR